MKDGTLVVQRFALFAHALFTGAERAKVLRRLGHGLSKETHDDATASVGSFDFYIKEDLACDLFEVTANEKKHVKKW